MRRLLFVCVLAVIVSSAPAVSLPGSTGQTATPSAPHENSASANTASAPTVVANGITARALAVDTSESAAESSDGPTVYLTAAAQQNRVLALSAGLKPASVSSPASALSPNSQIVPIAGVGPAGSLGDGGAALAAQFNLKLDSVVERSGVAVAPDGTIFIADTENATIRRVAGPASNEPGVIRSVAGRWGPRQNIGLVEPLGIALDRAGNLYIAAHAANAILVLLASAADPVGTLELPAHVVEPASIATTLDGHKIFVASPDTGKMFAIATANRAIEELALPTSGATAPAASTSCSPASTSLGGCPAGLAVDGAGNLFVADARTGAILRFDAATGKTTLAKADLAAPGEIAFDADGDLFVAEQGRNRIVELRALGVPVNGVSLSPPSNDYGDEPTGGATPTIPFTLANNSASALTGITAGFQGTNPGDFQNPSSSCTATLAANSSCAFNVAFAPGTGAVPARQAQLAVSYTGATSALTSTLTGTADDFEIAAVNNITLLSVDAGTAATYMLQINPDAIFSGTVTFVCPSNLPAETTCTINSGSSTNITSINVTPNTPVPISAVFQTTSRVPQPPPKSWTPFFPGLGTARRLPFSASIALLAFLGCAMLAAYRSSRARKAASILAVFIAAVALLGCGHKGTSGSVTGTPVGKTVMNFEVTSQNAARGITLTLFVD